jgi:aspartyl-tRNA(Asn)/glutamyl-tRNA(Gln) amidotransferase subunit A
MDLAWIGIVEAGRLYRDKKLSPVELVQALLERIGRLDGKVHAFIRLEAEGALAAARRAEADFQGGKARGPLHGIPYVLKDNIDVAGVPTTCSSRVMNGHVAAADAPVAKSLREAGGINLGKVTLHEFARGGSMFGLPFPAARNPWNLKLHPGGSSSGSGVALACGFAPAAIGTDTGGSVRHPATVCGIVGMKPSFDLVSCEGVFPLSPSLDHVGPMTRSVEDNALVLEAMTGHAGRYTAPLAGGVKGLRIGVIEHFWTEQNDVNADHLANLQAALKVLRGLGARVEPVKLSPLKDWTECGRLIQTWEQYNVHAEWLKTRPQDYSAFAREKLLEGSELKLEDVQAAGRRRESLRAELAETMKAWDVLVTLSSFQLPCEVDDEAAVRRTYSSQGRIPFNLTGTPCISLPTGFTPVGLPTAMQIAGKMNDEAMIYRVSKAYEDATRWGERHPAGFQ